jgi:hypothetical protein
MKYVVHELLHWLTHNDVACTNAAQASVRLKHRRHDIDDVNEYLAQHPLHPQAADTASTETRATPPASHTD